MPISSIVEAARVPQQLLGELFVEKGLITAEELAEALAEQKETGKRIGQILVRKGFVSGPSLTTVLAEQLGVEMEKQEGFGAGLWSEIKRRHPRTKDRRRHGQSLRSLWSPWRPPRRTIDGSQSSTTSTTALRSEQVDWMALDDGDRRAREPAPAAALRVDETRGGARRPQGNAATARGVPQGARTSGPGGRRLAGARRAG